MDLASKTVIVVGLGTSGVAACRLAAARGAHVVATDQQALDALPHEVRTLDADLRVGGHAQVAFDQADVVVVSPGVPSRPELDQAEAAGVLVIGELELASRCVTAPVCCIGGTNGKSTTTVLTADILAQAGYRVFRGANLGTPACEAATGSWDVMVWEVSSFQLERSPTFRPHVSVLLNVTEDHLDRYSGLGAYAEAKGRAFVNQGPEDVAVVPSSDRICAEQAGRGRGRRVTFGVEGDYRVVGRSVVETATGGRFSLQDVPLHGLHNLTNAAAAIAAARAMGADPDAIEPGVAGFRPLPHRMAFAGEIAGVRFYDDSKGTNVGAAVTALLGLSEPRGVLIAGGRDKLGAYAPLVDALERKGRAVVVIGEAGDRIAAAVSGRLPVEHAASMQEAVVRARRLAAPGDAVLLSPACSSFDMFRDYADRGRQFVAAVERLREGSA